ncbi:MAG: trypsin-like peptidase domain-containing protein [Chloroflexota bacterium]|nr:trypsin-like peptidase domain-containing protein [Chloroflexota bacterium]
MNINKIIIYTIFSLLVCIGCDNQDWQEAQIEKEYNPSEISSIFEKQYKETFTKVVESVVQINLYNIDSQGIPTNRSAAGAGFFWDAEGNILTNYHVIQPAISSNKKAILVRTYKDNEYKAEIKGYDSYSDLAIIQIDKNQSNNLFSPLELYDSDVISPGELTLAIGSPFDQEFTLTTGIVSAIGRTLDSSFTPYKIPNVIQTDAAINPGNSGGPLLNSKGKVIGINTQIKSDSRQNSGVGFAVPINLAKKVVPNIIDGNQHFYSYLGINALNLDYGSRIRANVEDNFKGLLILNVLNEGPAHLAGIKGDSSIQPDLNFDGDIITKIDEYKVDTFEDLMSYLALNTQAGDIVKIEVVRDYQYQEIEVELQARPD